MTLNRTGMFLAALGLSAAALAAADKDPGQPKAVKLHAVAVNMSNVGRAGAVPVDIDIEHWSTAADAAKLKAALEAKHDPADQLRDLKRLGFIRRSDGGLGWDIRYARRDDLPDGGYRVVFATDRPMSFGELINRPITSEYDVVMAEVHVGADGKGEGKLVPMAKATYDDDKQMVEIENYASEPVQLTNVTEMGQSDKHPAKKME